MNKRNIVRAFMIENPNLTEKKGIARMLFEKHPDLFESLEQARSTVRQVTGASGEDQRRRIKDPKMTKFFYNGFEKWSKENLNTEPRPWDEPFVFPNFKTLNIIADLHSVHLCYRTLQKFLKQTEDKTALLINGDLMDSESLSRHLKGHNLIEYENELELCHTILKGLKEEFDHVYFKAGNHDYWLERYLLINAREIFKLRGLEIQELLQCAALGVHYIHNLKYMTYGDLDIIHGHEFPGFGAGKFPSVSVLDRWQTFKHKYDVKILASHSHKNDTSLSRKSKDGKFGQAWVTPAMCRKAAGYNPYAGWDNGWAVARFDETTTVELVVV